MKIGSFCSGIGGLDLAAEQHFGATTAQQPATRDRDRLFRLARADRGPVRQALRKRLGRSPDSADALLLCLVDLGPGTVAVVTAEDVLEESSAPSPGSCRPGSVTA